MAAPARKHRSRRRVAAFNFLSNISLDGTHRDTKYAIFNRKGLFESEGSQSIPSRSQTEPENLKDSADANDENRPPATPCPDAAPAADKTGSSNGLSPDLFDHSVTREPTDTTGPSKRYRRTTRPPLRRASSYSGERPHHHQKLLHTLSISEDSPTDRRNFSNTDVLNDILSVSSVLSGGTRLRHRSTSSSTSSIGSAGAKPKKEVRFIKPGRHKPIKKERESYRKGKLDQEMQWQDMVRMPRPQQKIVVLLSTRKAPFVIYSALPYNKYNNVARGEHVDKAMLRHPSGGHLTTGQSVSNEGLLHLGLLAVEKVEDGQECVIRPVNSQDISYSQFLVPSKNRNFRKMVSVEGTLNPISESAQSSPGIVPHTGGPLLVARSLSYDPTLVTGRRHPALPSHDREQESSPGDFTYNPNILDDPELRSGKHRTLMTFPSYMISVIDYAKPSELKRELNEKFKEKFPHIPLSLSKLRSLKRDLHKIAHVKSSVDLWSVAQSYVYFEKIILKGLINKPNRRLCAGACLMLSAKLNDVKGPDLTKLIQETEDTFKLHRRDLLAFEFAVLVALEFSLLVADQDVYPHYQRLIYTA